MNKKNKFFILITLSCLVFVGCSSSEVDTIQETNVKNQEQNVTETETETEMVYDYKSKELKEVDKYKWVQNPDIVVYDVDNEEISNYLQVSNPKKIHTYQNRFQETGNAYGIGSSRAIEVIDIETGNYYLYHSSGYNFNLTPLYNENKEIQNIYQEQLEKEESEEIENVE